MANKVRNDFADTSASNYYAMNSSQNMGKTTSYFINYYEIDLNKGNNIYQDNVNVRPNHYVVEFWIKYK